MWKKGLDLFLAKYLSEHYQYPQPTMIWWICDLIFWCNNSKEIFFLDGISPKNACFLCAFCGNVTAFFSFVPKYTVQNPLWNKQVCPKFINVIIENNLLHKSGAKSTLCNLAMKGSLLLSYILHSYLSFSPRCDMMYVRDFNMFICILYRSWNIIRNLWCHVENFSII